MTLVVEPDRLVEIARSIPSIEGVSSGESEPCCDFVDPDTLDPTCDRPAAWALRSRCCGFHCLGCAGHVKALMLRYTGPAGCKKCGREFDGAARMYSCTRL